MAAARANGYHGNARTTRIVLLIQHRAGERYSLRGYDLVTKKLSVPIIDTRELDEKMQDLSRRRGGSRSARMARRSASRV